MYVYEFYMEKKNVTENNYKPIKRRKKNLKSEFCICDAFASQKISLKFEQ